MTAVTTHLVYPSGPVWHAVNLWKCCCCHPTVCQRLKLTTKISAVHDSCLLCRLCKLCVSQGEKSLQAVQGTKPAIITASRPITKMIVTQPKGLSSGSQSTATKIIPTKIVYGQQGKTQVSRRHNNLLYFMSLMCLFTLWMQFTTISAC